MNRINAKDEPATTARPAKIMLELADTPAINNAVVSIGNISPATGFCVKKLSL